MSDWTDSDEEVRDALERMEEGIAECPDECSEWGGFCDVCAIRMDYMTALRAILRVRSGEAA